jgi:hypothetical protein
VVSWTPPNRLRGFLRQLVIITSCAACLELQTRERKCCVNRYASKTDVPESNEAGQLAIHATAFNCLCEAVVYANTEHASNA